MITRFRKIKLLIGAFVLTLLGVIINSCRPVINTCYKTAPPDDKDSSEFKTIRNSCYDMPAEPMDTIINQ